MGQWQWQGLFLFSASHLVWSWSIHTVVSNEDRNEDGDWNDPSQGCHITCDVIIIVLCLNYGNPDLDCLGSVSKPCTKMVSVVLLKCHVETGTSIYGNPELECSEYDLRPCTMMIYVVALLCQDENINLWQPLLGVFRICSIQSCRCSSKAYHGEPTKTNIWQPWLGVFRICSIQTKVWLLFRVLFLWWTRQKLWQPWFGVFRICSKVATAFQCFTMVNSPKETFISWQVYLDFSILCQIHHDNLCKSTVLMDFWLQVDIDQLCTV